MGDSTFSYLDAYCERAGASGILAEPINAVTNLAFLIAAWLAWKKLHSEQKTNWCNCWDIVLLIVLLASIGLGSGLWHSFATPTTMIADVIPILLFINIFLLSALIRLCECRLWLALLLWGLFQVINFGSEAMLPRSLFNGSIMYAPTYLTLALMTLWLFYTRNLHARNFVIALLIWTCSIVFRTVDNTICNAIPFGTHFLWHLLNAVVLYLLLVTLIQKHTKRK